MVVVLDASVLVKLFLAEPYSDAAAQLLSSISVVHVPDLARFEVAGAITRAARRKVITAEDAADKLGEWREFAKVGSLRYTPFQDLMADAETLSLQIKHALADCVYLALARRVGVGLVTADEPLVTAAAEFVPNVRHLRDLLH